MLRRRKRFHGQRSPQKKKKRSFVPLLHRTAVVLSSRRRTLQATSNVGPPSTQPTQPVGGHDVGRTHGNPCPTDCRSILACGARRLYSQRRNETRSAPVSLRATSIYNEHARACRRRQQIYTESMFSIIRWRRIESVRLPYVVRTSDGCNARNGLWATTANELLTTYSSFSLA